jgi:hypothetical protein
VSPMPDNWGYVLAAYGVAAAAFIGYWRYLSARSRALTRGKRGKGHGA